MTIIKGIKLTKLPQDDQNRSKVRREVYTVYTTICPASSSQNQRIGWCSEDSICIHYASDKHGLKCYFEYLHDNKSTKLNTLIS